MNWEIIGKYLPLYQKAAVLTVKIGFMGIAAAIMIGLLCTIIQYYKIPVIRRIVSVYIGREVKVVVFVARAEVL